MIKIFLYICLVYTFSVIAQSQTIPLITDRPDQTESSATIPKNHLQIETGFVFEKDKNDAEEIQLYNLASTLLRYGIVNSIELRISSGYKHSKISTNGTKLNDSGINGLGIGTKVHLFLDKNITS